jgi:hypothetical protein
MQFIFGSRFLTNSFFQGLTSNSVVRLLEECKQLKVKAGEFVYQKGQVADK